MVQGNEPKIIVNKTIESADDLRLPLVVFVLLVLLRTVLHD